MTAEALALDSTQRSRFVRENFRQLKFAFARLENRCGCNLPRQTRKVERKWNDPRSQNSRVLKPTRIHGPGRTGLDRTAPDRGRGTKSGAESFDFFFSACCRDESPLSHLHGFLPIGKKSKVPPRIVSVDVMRIITVCVFTV